MPANENKNRAQGALQQQCELIWDNSFRSRTPLLEQLLAVICGGFRTK